jgi:hypothetical protein
MNAGTLPDIAKLAHEFENRFESRLEQVEREVRELPDTA